MCNSSQQHIWQENAEKKTIILNAPRKLNKMSDKLSVNFRQSVKTREISVSAQAEAFGDKDRFGIGAKFDIDLDIEEGQRQVELKLKNSKAFMIVMQTVDRTNWS